VGAYVQAYGRYVWPVRTVEDIKLAPFHLLASENAVHTDRDHRWHLQTLQKLCREDDVLLETAHAEVDLADPSDEEKVISWWEDLTGPGRGGEGNTSSGPWSSWRGDGAASRSPASSAAEGST